MYRSILSLTSSLDALVVKGTFRSLDPRERTRTHCIGGWMGHGSCLDGCGISPPPGFDPWDIYNSNVFVSFKMIIKKSETFLVILSEVKHENDFQQTVPTMHNYYNTHTHIFTYNPLTLQHISIFSISSSGKSYIKQTQKSPMHCQTYRNFSP